MGHPADLCKEDVNRHKKLQVLERFFHLYGIRILPKRVTAGYYHAPYLSLSRGKDFILQNRNR